MTAGRRLFLIRHGETPSNAARIFQTPDTPLSEVGRAQARALARRLRAESIGLVIASDYARAAETGRAVADALGAPLELETLLRERNFGDLRGVPYVQVGGDPFRPDYAPPNGESWDEFHDRVDRAWGALSDALDRCPRDLAVVTHGLVCRALVDRRLDASGLTEDARAPLAGFANTSVTIASATAPFRIEQIACIRHLAADAPLGAPA